MAPPLLSTIVGITHMAPSAVVEFEAQQNGMNGWRMQTSNIFPVNW